MRLLRPPANRHADVHRSSIAWLSRVALDHGMADVRIHGVLLATVDLSRDLTAFGPNRRAMF